jgi:hypothetical protein
VVLQLKKAKDRKNLFLGFMQIDIELITYLMSMTNTGRGYFSSHKFVDLWSLPLCGGFSSYSSVAKKQY